MRLFRLEHTKLAYHMDFVVYGAASILLAAVLVLGAPAGHSLVLATLVAAGLAGWTAVEYVLHRFVLHGVDPFRGWHAEHHRRPFALIGAPAILGAPLVAGFVFLPVWLSTDVWLAVALTLGIVSGYLGYAITHHAIHHWRAERGWLKRRKRWHAQHHDAGRHPGRFGVTSDFWDRVFGSGR